MATINALMRHLRDMGVKISGSTQKRKLRRIGYYHGYKGYRFAGSSSNMLPITDFNEIVALHDFDMQLKALFYSPLMSIETALKNRVLEAVLEDAKSEKFDDVFKHSLTAYRTCPRADYKSAWASRLGFRTEIDRLIAQNHDTKDVIKHFRDQDRDIPIWAIFEIITLGNFGSFYNCLNDKVKNAVVTDLNMPTQNFDSAKVLKKIIFALKDLRNAVAHNGIVIDVRFKTASVHRSVGELLNFEIHTSGVTFSDITDYTLLLVYLMARLGFSKTECKQLLQGYEDLIEHYRSVLPYNIFSQFVGTQTRQKLADTAFFIKGL